MVHISAIRIAGDLVAFGVLVATAVVLKTVVKSAQSGFFCNDPTLFLPYRDSTIPSPLLHFLTFFLPIILIAGIEICTWFFLENGNDTETYRVGKWRIHHLIAMLYYFLGFFMIGSIVNRIICDVAKYTTGQLRPNFISICRPANLSICERSNYYIEAYNCTNNDERQVFDVHLSFCSGHTAYSFYAATYLYFYLQTRLKNRYTSDAFLMLIHCGIFMLATFIGCTRLKDHKHHLSNVYFGGILGFIVGYTVAVHFARIPKYFCCDEIVVKKEKCSPTVNQGTVASISAPVVSNASSMKFRRSKVSDNRTDDSFHGFESGK